jgi:hypothetical protein
VDNLSTIQVTEGIIWTFSTGYPPGYPLPKADVGKTVDKRVDNGGQAVDKLGVTFIAHAARTTVAERCG